MSGARETILGRLRRAVDADAAEAESPALATSTYDDRSAHFAMMLEAAGGRCRRVADAAELHREVAALPAVAEARVLVSTLDELDGALLRRDGGEVRDLSRVDDPHALAEVDVAILPGHFGVAENGAVWVSDRGLSQRAVYFLPQHVVLVVAADQLVDTLHDAYGRISFEGPGFGCFVAGPSKTADIEQALVIGAHGPRSLTVFLLGPEASS